MRVVEREADMYGMMLVAGYALCGTHLFFITASLSTTRTFSAASADWGAVSGAHGPPAPQSGYAFVPVVVVAIVVCM